MKVGLIPPRGLENFALASDFHLALALPNMIQRRAYGGMYKHLSEMGDFVVLDNGAAEGALAPNYTIWEIAHTIKPHEIVVPDAMGDYEKTILCAKAFFDKYNGNEYELEVDMRYMGVMQGRDKKELQACVEAFTQLPITTIGIPRHLLTSYQTLHGSPTTIRIDMANWIEERYPHKFAIHLLGTNPAWLGEVRAAHKYAEHIRSVDTSMPFNYGLMGVALSSMAEKLTRDRNYFVHDWGKNANVGLLRDNVRTFMSWAGTNMGRDPEDPKWTSPKVSSQGTH